MAEKKIAPTQSFAQPVDRLDAPQPIQRRVGGHDPRAQLRQNAQFMAQMKAQQAPVVQRKEDHLYGTGGPQMGQDRQGAALEEGESDKLDYLRACIAKTNVYLRGLLAVLRQYGHHPNIAKVGVYFSTFVERLSNLAKTASGAKWAGQAITIANGLLGILSARNTHQFVDAVSDTATHLAMGLCPVTMLLDVILTAVFGADWPSRAFKAIAELLVAAFKVYFKAWQDHYEGTGEMLIPAGPRKM